jgi:hypothetical protein
VARPELATARSTGGCPPPHHADRAAVDEARQVLGGDAALAGLVRNVDLDQHLRLRPTVTAELGQRGVGGDRVDVADVRQDVLDLAALQLPDEVPGEPARRRRGLGHELLGAVLAHDGDTAVGQCRQLLDRQIFDRGQDLHLRRVASGRCDRLPCPGQVARHRLRPQPADQVNHATPAWRPVTPRSRRWENSRAGSEQIVQIPMSAMVVAPTSRSCRRAIALRSRLRP